MVSPFPFWGTLLHRMLQGHASCVQLFGLVVIGEFPPPFCAFPRWLRLLIDVEIRWPSVDWAESLRNYFRYFADLWEINRRGGK